MEEKLLELLKLADKLNKKQNKFYAEITYSADESKTLELAIRSKENFSYVEKCRVQLKEYANTSINNIVALLTCYINGGGSNE